MTRPLHIITIGVVLLLGVPAMPLAGVAADQPDQGTHDLGDGVRAYLDAGGNLRLDLADDPSTILLESSWPAVGRVGDVWQARSEEGAPGGHRGLASDADDDGDGHRDEDRLDGRDNDGDGLVDEDFAAVSHHMTVWNGRDQGGDRHLETYHWTYPSLRRLVALTIADASGLAPPFQLDLPRGMEWQAMDRGCVDAGSIFQAELETGWLAVLVLDSRPRAQSWQRLRAADERLTLPLLDGELTVIVGTGASRMQLVNGLMSAVQLHEGMTDPVSGDRMPWLPPAGAHPVQPEGPITVQADLAEGSQLRLAVAADCGVNLDPDQMLGPDGTLVPVMAVAWEPAEGEVLQLPWPPPATEPPCRLSVLLDQEGDGVLVFSVAQTLPEGWETLTIRRDDGRPLNFDLEHLPRPVTEDPETDRWDDGSGSVVHLAANLVGNFPNPFRFSTRISYRVPATVGEAFDLTAPGAPELEPSRNMPYANDSPQVEVSVFSLEGRRVATLHTGRQGPGQYEVSWNGTDEQGRSLPSGAYFCKLQIEKWSVTKRLIFVR